MSFFSSKDAILEFVLIIILIVLIFVVMVFSGIAMTHIKSIPNYSKETGLHGAFKYALGSFLAALIGFILIAAILGLSIYYHQSENKIVINITMFLVIVVLAVSGILGAVSAEKLTCTNSGSKSYAHHEITIAAVIGIISFTFALVIAYKLSGHSSSSKPLQGIEIEYE